jgi:hypothetical protein
MAGSDPYSGYCDPLQTGSTYVTFNSSNYPTTLVTYTSSGTIIYTHNPYFDGIDTILDTPERNAFKELEALLNKYE